MIRDGAGAISSGDDVTLELWVPHLADLLKIISGEGPAASEDRIRDALADVEAGELKADGVSS